MDITLEDETGTIIAHIDSSNDWAFRIGDIVELEGFVGGQDVLDVNWITNISLRKRYNEKLVHSEKETHISKCGILSRFFKKNGVTFS